MLRSATSLFPEVSTNTCFRDSEEAFKGWILSSQSLVFSPRLEAHLPFSCLLLPVRSILSVGCAAMDTRGGAEEGMAGWASGAPEILKQAGLASWCLGEQVSSLACMRGGD